MKLVLVVFGKQLFIIGMDFLPLQALLHECGHVTRCLLDFQVFLHERGAVERDSPRQMRIRRGADVAQEVLQGQGQEVASKLTETRLDRSNQN